MRFLVKTLQPDTAIGSTLLDATDAADAGRQASAQGYAVLSVTPASLLQRLSAPRASDFPLLLFSRELFSLLDSGIAIVEAIETLAPAFAAARRMTRVDARLNLG